jgi:Trehalose synthase, N-terminal domain
MHNTLQGGEINLSDRKMDIYEAIIYENAIRNHLGGHNMVIVDDPQTLPMLSHYKKKGDYHVGDNDSGFIGERGARGWEKHCQKTSV